jgi:hypothetical protein
MSNIEIIHTTDDQEYVIEREFNRAEDASGFLDEHEKLAPAVDKYWVYSRKPQPAFPRYLGSFENFEGALDYLNKFQAA